MESVESSLLIRMTQGIRDTKSRARLACVCKVVERLIILLGVMRQLLAYPAGGQGQIDRHDDTVKLCISGLALCSGRLLGNCAAIFQ